MLRIDSDSVFLQPSVVLASVQGLLAVFVAAGVLVWFAVVTSMLAGHLYVAASMVPLAAEYLGACVLNVVFFQWRSVVRVNISRNLTTNEVMNRHRYKHLQDGANPFHAGTCLRNWALLCFLDSAISFRGADAWKRGSVNGGRVCSGTTGTSPSPVNPHISVPQPRFALDSQTCSNGTR